MRSFSSKPKTTQQTSPGRSSMRGRTHSVQDRHVNPILQLQRSIGNQAVGRLLQAQQKHEDQSTTGEVVANGLNSAGSRLPHLARIQSSFGRHDVGGVRAHLDAGAADANRKLNAEAYTYGNQVAFAGPPSLRTAAHEAAHVVQQRSGVHLKDNVGVPGDAYERHADAVASLVVEGTDAAPLLDQMAGSTEVLNTAPVVQMQPRATASQIPGFQKMIDGWVSIDKIKGPLIRALAKEYVIRPGQIKVPDIGLHATPYVADKLNPRAFGEPSEARVVDALYPVMDLKKGAKGIDWSLELAGESGPEMKSGDERRLEVAKFATEQAISKTFDKTSVDLGIAGVKTLATGQFSAVSAVEAISKPVAEWIMKDVLRVSAKVVGKAIPIIGWIWTAYDVIDLLISLNAPADKELSPYQMESANIVAGVKAYLEGKQQAAQLQEATKGPLHLDYLKAKQDATVVRPH